MQVHSAVVGVRAARHELGGPVSPMTSGNSQVPLALAQLAPSQHPGPREPFSAITFNVISIGHFAPKTLFPFLHNPHHFSL